MTGTRLCVGEHGRAGSGMVLAPCHETTLLLSCSYFSVVPHLVMTPILAPATRLGLA